MAAGGDLEFGDTDRVRVPAQVEGSGLSES